ncbi:MAG: DUF3343 domain-containing protein [Clostridia bacterium]|nr:DUF3343 domain-containing protein [Clostridia bacterium]
MSVLATGSMTATVKIKKLLQREGINVDVVKLDPMKSRDGCAYGIEIKNDDLLVGVNILKKNGVLYHLYEGNKNDLS